MVNTPERLLAFSSLPVCCLAWIARRLPGRSASPQLSDGELEALRSKLLNAVIDNCTAPELEMLLQRAPRSQRAHLANSVYDDHGKSQKTALFLASRCQQRQRSFSIPCVYGARVPLQRSKHLRRAIEMSDCLALRWVSPRMKRAPRRGLAALRKGR